MSAPGVSLPPYAALLGATIVAGSPDDAPVLRMDFTPGLSGRPGYLHGGAIAGLLEMAAHAALTASLIAAGQEPRFKPIGITIDYVRGGKEQPTFARGRVTRVGKRVATVVVEAWQEEGGPHIAAARLHMLMSEDGQQTAGAA
jgi:uncharacterized protein (TIGR00369 family)